MAQICWKCGALPATLESFLGPTPSFSPDFGHLLASNNVPLDSEIPLIRRIVSDGEDRIAALTALIGAFTAQIQHLEDVISQLNDQRDEATEQVHKYRTIVSPVRRVPPELVCEIFALSAAKDRAHNVRPPWRLGGICQSWRQYALAYPRLWSTIVIPSHRSASGKNGPFLAWNEAQLLRSANAPLDIYAAHIRTGDPDPQLLDLIIPHCARWRSIYLHFNRSCALNWLHRVSGRLDRLEKLEVVKGHVATFPDVFSAAPNLREVILADNELAASTPSILIPWGQITRYWGVYSAKRQLEVLGGAPNLLECVMDFRDSVFLDPDYHPTTMVTLPPPSSSLLGISTFSLTHRNPCPRGTILFVRRRGPDTVPPPVCSSIFLHAHKAGIMEILTHLLLENNIDAEHEQGALFNALSILGTSNDLCPNLASVVYGYESFSDISWGSFCSMVRSRLRPRHGHVRRLRLFYSGLYSYGPRRYDVDLETLQDEGFDVAFIAEDERKQFRENLFI
ncbi:F-box domain-containing protein [Mycena venus]|uniref:F-box domain-containing protein n=1 Tax=Mycena venus TaxID=2733690 RepID=A0A8H6XW66_9AGAR|nr:F-box domain-containing protein [Mycena venus]